MGAFKAEAVGLVESVLVKYGRLDDGSLYASLTEELLDIGAAEFAKKYDYDAPSSSISTKINLRGQFITQVQPVTDNEGTVRSVLVELITPHGAAEIYLQDPDTAMKVMAAFAKAGSVLGGNADEHSRCATS